MWLFILSLVMYYSTPQTFIKHNFYHNRITKTFNISILKNVHVTQYVGIDVNKNLTLIMYVVNIHHLLLRVLRYVRDYYEHVLKNIFKIVLSDIYLNVNVILSQYKVNSVRCSSFLFV